MAAAPPRGAASAGRQWWSRDAAKHAQRSHRQTARATWAPSTRAATTTPTFHEPQRQEHKLARSRPSASSPRTAQHLHPPQRSRGIATTAPKQSWSANEAAASTPGAASGAHRDEWHPGAVHVRIEPRPRTLRESAEVLHALRRFGEVEMFRHLKYAPQAPAMHVALAIFRSPDAAARAIVASPVGFAFGGGVDEAQDDELRRDDAALDRAEPLLQTSGESVEKVDASELAAATDNDGAAAAMDADDPDGSDDPDFRSDLDTARDLFSAGDPAVFPSGRQSTAIKPPWEMTIPRSESSQPSSSSSSPLAPSETMELRTETPSQRHESHLDASANANTDNNADTDADADLDPIAPAPPLAVDPARPISLPRLPERPPPVAAAPAYRHSALSPRARVHDAAPPPSFADDATHAPAPRAGSLVVSASGFAHRFYNARQPYFGAYAVSAAASPGDGVVADLPPALRGLADSNVAKQEPVARQRARKEAKRREMDVLQGKSLTELWREGARDRSKRGVV